MEAGLVSFLSRLTGLGTEVVSKLLVSAAIMTVLWLSRFLVMRNVWRATSESRIRYMWQKTTAYIAMALGAVVIARVWFPLIGSPATYLGLLSAGVAVALKDPLTGVAGWLFIVIRRPFTLGDRIQIGTTAGDVIDLRLFAFSILEIGNWVEADQSTGRIIHVPNGRVFTDTIANYNQGFRFIWNEIRVLLTFESDWTLAKKLLLEIAEHHSLNLGADAKKDLQEASRKFMVQYARLTPIVYTDVRDSGVLLTIRYLCHPKSRRSTQEAIWEDILRALAGRRDICLAYGTTRVILDGAARDGDPGAGGGATV